MLEKRLAKLEAKAGITPDPSTVINSRITKTAESQQITEVKK